MLWAALRLLWWLEEGKGYLPKEVGPLASGCHRLGIPDTRRAMPPCSESSRYLNNCLLLGVDGVTSLELGAGRHLIPLQDSIISGWSWFPAMCWVWIVNLHEDWCKCLTCSSILLVRIWEPYFPLVVVTNAMQHKYRTRQQTPCLNATWCCRSDYSTIWSDG